MKETLYTQTLARAADAEGGTAALAGVLHVPEKTLERWMSGRAQTPLRAFLRAADTALPPSESIDAFLREQQPDVMLITPLIGVVGSPQPDYVRAARARRITTATAVWSWVRRL